MGRRTRVSFGSVGLVFTWMFILCDTCFASTRSIGQITPGFKVSQMNYIDNNGLFLLSNDSNFAFGFSHVVDPKLFLLVVVHFSSSSRRVVWAANRDSLVQNSDDFVFGNNGNVYLESGQGTVWSTGTTGKGATSLELQNSGNLVLRGRGGSILWQSFDHPSDTLLSGQEFREGMQLVSNTNSNNLSYHLKIESGDMLLYVDFPTPQPYWSMGKETRKTINKVNNDVSSATLVTNSWNFFDRSRGLLWQFIFSSVSDSNVTWAAVLGDDGVIAFYTLQSGGSSMEDIKVPQDPCSTPDTCGSYFVCYSDNRCQCPSAFNSRNCDPGFVSSCKSSGSSMQLLDLGDRLNYFALGFVSPFSKSDLNGCKDACVKNCSCGALFFEASSQNCYLFDQIGSLRQSDQKSAGFISFVKVSINGDRGGSSDGKGGGNSRKHIQIVVIIVVVTLVVIAGLLYLGLRYHKKNKMLPDSPREMSEDDNFLESLAGMPLRFSYKELEDATNNFTLKLGQGGFGSVYQGKLKDGSEIAVKQLEGIGQGKKEFRAEVSIIGSIHHTHLVRLRGFCAEGSHRLLVYEYMANGSLDKWIFKKNAQGVKLDWVTRYNIAVGTAKGLAYLHEDCDVKIVHCDIKPENVLLDEHFHAKVSDFGLAKLMNREQSHVFTTMRGTRGYLAPEWITNYAISEKSDVYSYGMVLLELIGGRKNYIPSETSEKSHFPTYALKMAEEKKLNEILDPNIKIHEDDGSAYTAIQVALWCIQEDMYLRPSMSRVVQMLEGICAVPQPPTSSQMGSRLYSNFFKSMSEGGTTSSGLSDFNSNANLSAVQLSGPR